MSVLFYFFLVRQSSWVWLYLWSWSPRLFIYVRHSQSYEHDWSFIWMRYQCSWLLSSSYGHLVLCLYTSLLTVSVFYYHQYLGVTLTQSQVLWPHG